MAQSSFENPDSTVAGAVDGQASVDARPIVDGPAGADRNGAREVGAWIGRHPWGAGAIALVAVAIVVVQWANTRPGFDPYGWLTWGQETLHLTLNTNAAPSWKPLPYLFTVPFALFGHLQLWLWMVASVAIALSGAVFAARIAHRVIATEEGARAGAALIAGALAGLGLNLITQAAPTISVWHYILSDQSDPMIVALCLGAIDCHLGGRHRWAVWLAVLAGLGRPEVWALLGPYGLWLWVRRPELRVMLVAAAAVLLVLWFGIPAISSRSPFVAADNAFYSGRRLTHNQIVGTISRFLHLLPRGLEVTALLSVGLAVWRRDRTTLGLAAAVLVWLVVEIAMVLHGWPGVPRYMFEPAALVVVIAAIGVGRVLAAPPRIGEALGISAAVRESGAVVLALAAVVSVIPVAISDARAEHHDLREQRLRTRTLNLLHSELAGYGGGSRFKACGEPLTRLQYQSAVAWELGVNVANVGFKYGPAIASTRPIVLITPYPQPGSGWKISALRQTANAFCRSLPGGA